MYNPHYHTILITLTTVSLLSSTINRSSLNPDPLQPPNSAAFLSPTGVSVKWDNGGGGCPVMFGELHSPAGGDDIISHYYWYNTTQWYNVHVQYTFVLLMLLLS